MRPNLEAEHDKKDKRKIKEFYEEEKYFTLSKKGITTYIKKEPVEYISLNDWIHD